MDFHTSVIRVAFPTLWNVFVQVNKRLVRSAKRTKESQEKAIERLTKLFQKDAAQTDLGDEELEVIEDVANWLFGTPRSDAELAFLFGLTDDEPGTSPNRQRRLMLLSNNLHCPSTWWYHKLQQALSTRKFHKIEESRYPTAPLHNRTGHAKAQLRPPAVDPAVQISPEVEDYWVAQMWKQREELSDLDADVLDCLSARWIAEASNPDDLVKVEVDSVLRMRGIQPKISGQGRRGGYRPEQRAEIVRSIEHLENVWFDLLEIQVYAKRRNGARVTPISERLQSRAVVITDRIVQTDLIGNTEIRAITFRPGQVFSHFLFGPGHQVALFSFKTVKYPLSKKFEKRLARYLGWQWRIKARNSQYLQPYRVKTLVEAIELQKSTRYMSRTKDRFEKALDQLEEDGLINAWQYCEEESSKMMEASEQPACKPFELLQRWLNELVWIEPPDSISQRYREMFANYREKTGRDDELSDAVEGKRVERELTRLRLAEALDIPPRDIMKIESSGSVSEPVRKKVQSWLDQTNEVRRNLR